MARTNVGIEVPSTSKADIASISASVISSNNCDMDKLKTTEILMAWPIVCVTITKIVKTYETLKSSSKVLHWSSNVSEKLARALYERSAPVRAVLCPALRIADLAASEVAETVQKKLPIVKKSPSEVYDDMKSRVSTNFASLWNMIEFFVKSGERRLRRVAVRITGASCRVAAAVNEWLDEAEKYINAHSKGGRVKNVENENSETHAVRTKAWVPVATAFNWTTTVAMFYVGVATWVISRVPVVGQFVNPSPASSKSSSPASEKSLKSSSSSYETLPESVAAATTTKMRRSMLNLERQGLD